MNKLKNLKLKTNLILGFGVSLFICGIVIIFSLVGLHSVTAGYDKILDKVVKADETIALLRVDANIAARNARDIALIPDDPANPQLEARAYEVMEEMTVLMDELRASYPEEADIELLNEYCGLVEEWQAEVPGIIDAAMAGKQEKAAKLVMTSCTPKLNAMAEKAIEINTLMGEIQEAAVENEDRYSLILQIIILIGFIVATVIAVFMASTIIRSITVPTKELHTAIVGFSQGDLDIPVEYESKNEIGEICDAMRTSQHILSNVIDDQCNMLGAMANGDFTVTSKDEALYVGSLESLIISANEIKYEFNDTLSQIHDSAGQVSAGSEQMSSGAQALAQGATEQASSVQQLAATISEIADKVHTNAEYANEGSSQAKTVGEGIMQGNEQMQEMMTAMDEISEKSLRINNIIKTIEDIAFQTNILALNAAVEAARAGDAGKGFAVVADEVRNLASKSAEASQDIATLIEEAVAAIKNGSEVAEDTAKTLLEVVEATKEIVNTVDQIAVASQEQAISIQQINEGVEQISAVVQTNSATAEQTAATSEELSGQANLLNSLVDHFQLEKDSHAF